MPTGILHATATATTHLRAAIELSYLIHLQTRARAKPCPACGSADVRRGLTTEAFVEFVCEQARQAYIDSMCRDQRGGRVGTAAAEHPAASEHYRRSKQRIEHRDGDEATHRALLELRDLRAAAGSHATVPVGARYRPPGGPVMVHLGDDEWMVAPGA